ncbi:hypothetical protein ACNQR7_02740 [Mycolicibacterium senegalense]|uniref:hypothetical protein n=1 Tax=Mycolicibacterium senegalense TaxID=1796 RepID=UPI003AABE0CE
MNAPCQCWKFINLHEGHCCFTAGTVDDYRPGQPAPCGHYAPSGMDEFHPDTSWWSEGGVENGS